MLDQVVTQKGRFSHDPEHSYTLPGEYYWQPEIAAREREAIFFRSWMLVGYTDDLKEDGSYITATLIDQPLFVVRGRDGKLRAFHNVCKHRGHLLLKDKGRKTRIGCPFHAWNYDLTGELIAAPNADKVPDFDYSEFHLSEIQVAEVARMVFVNLDPKARPFAEVYPNLEEEFRATVPAFDDLIRVRQDRYEISANWKSIFDGLECYHCAILHPGSMGKAGDRMQKSFESDEFDFHARHVIRGNRDMMDMGQAERFGVAVNAAMKDLTMWYVWPNILFMAHPGPSNFKVAHVWPTGPETSVRFIDQFTLTDPPSEDDLGQMAAHRRTFLEDVSAMESVQRGVHSLGYAPGRLMVDRERSWLSEHATHHFQNLIWNALNPVH